MTETTDDTANQAPKKDHLAKYTLIALGVGLGGLALAYTIADPIYNKIDAQFAANQIATNKATCQLSEDYVSGFTGHDTGDLPGTYEVYVNQYDHPNQLRLGLAPVQKLEGNCRIDTNSDNTETVIVSLQQRTSASLGVPAFTDRQVTNVEAFYPGSGRRATSQHKLGS